LVVSADTKNREMPKRI